MNFRAFSAVLQDRCEVQTATGPSGGARRLDLANGRCSLSFKDQNIYAAPGQALFAPTGSASEMLCWLFRDQILAKVLAGIADVRGISMAEREQRIAELEVEALRLEFVEEAPVTAGLEAGLEIHRRPAASAWALLDLRAAPVEALPQAGAIGHRLEAR